MQLAAATTSLPAATYRQWLSADLVRIHAERLDTGTRFSHVDRAANHFRDLPRFFPLAGATLDDAVHVARAVSRATANMPFRRDPDTAGFGYASAVAVLQAADGAWWGTVLGTGTGRRGLPVYDCAFPYTRIITAEPLHRDVRAIVGAQDELRFPRA
jgi:hypothetical protein